MSLLEINNLGISFSGLKAVDGLNLKIEKGDIVCIIGPSGSGKSTFLRCLNCMEDPTAGSIIFHGEDIADMKVDINKHRRNMGMVFQHFNLFNNKTVIKNILPTLGNEFIALIKETSVVSFVGAADLYVAFNYIGSNSYEFMVPYLVMAMIYIILVLIISAGIKIMERSLRKSDRRN